MYGKIHPKTGHETQGIRQIYCSTLSLTSAPDRDGYSTSRPGEGMRTSENLDVYTSIILVRILNKPDIRAWTEFNRL
jgi:hypothetical protein